MWKIIAVLALHCLSLTLTGYRHHFLLTPQDDLKQTSTFAASVENTLEPFSLIKVSRGNSTVDNRLLLSFKHVLS
ncbi:uncharacterized protein YALI1_C29905g [Yarrowia lipolytica]|uniref:Uncharacterized protein n=1 Tax=Yarrowia lipolytica TaxID=4952 RepID=A0A1D8NC59_YARLL|nr:hypothetical protein YALI1_C29905g [Yarrowia lipolytica]